MILTVKEEQKMESKNLKVVMGICKVLSILSKIGHVFCIIGIIGCAIGLSALIVTELVHVDISKYVVDYTDTTVNGAIASCMVGLLVSIAGTITTKLHNSYFLMVRKVGTPFTKESAQGFRTLGIINICVPVGLAIISAIVFAIFKAGTSEFDFVNSCSVGITMILLSFVLGYGAEIEEKKATGEQADK